MKRPLAFALSGVLLIPILAFRFGGWVVVTVDDLPDHIVAGKPIALSFVVRQHGATPLDGLRPRVTLWSGLSKVTARATPSAAQGGYVATITAPRAGDWTTTIESGFGGSEITLLPLPAVAAGAPAPRAVGDAERGHALFLAKGCVTCHVRGSEGAGGVKPGPDLTGKRYVAEYVATFLADPESSPLSRSTTPSGTRMPNLGLREREIASLVAFLNADRSVMGKAASRW